MLMEVYNKLVKCDEAMPVAANEVYFRTWRGRWCFLPAIPLLCGRRGGARAGSAAQPGSSWRLPGAPDGRAGHVRAPRGARAVGAARHLPGGALGRSSSCLACAAHLRCTPAPQRVAWEGPERCAAACWLQGERCQAR